MKADQDLCALTAEMLAVYHSLSDTGELTDETVKRLESLEGDYPAKVEAVAKLIAACNQREVALKNEAARFQMAAHRNEVAGEQLREYLLRSIRALGLDNVRGSVYAVSIRKSPPKLSLTAEAIAALPDELMVIDRRPNRKLIMEAYNIGALPLVEGISVDRDEHVQIRFV